MTYPVAGDWGEVSTVALVTLTLLAAETMEEKKTYKKQLITNNLPVIKLF